MVIEEKLIDEVMEILDELAEFGRDDQAGVRNPISRRRMSTPMARPWPGCWMNISA